MKSKPVIAIVVPCYNEKEVLNETSNRLEKLLTKLIECNKIGEHSYICFVDDGSSDNTWELIKELHNKNSLMFKGLKLSRNRGHQQALLAGLEYNQQRSDAIISIDADLQDDINVIEKFVDKYIEGYEVVYGVRNSRKTDTFFKRSTALIFYKIMQFLGVKIVYNYADYRLASSRVLDGLKEYKEVNLFLRGIFPTIGFKSTEVIYDRFERFAGESKYPFKKMLAFAIEGITSFSVFPLRMVTYLGFVSFLVTLILTGWAFYQRINNNVVQGWASTIISVYLIAAIQLMSVGLLGEYIGKIYMEVKARPRYLLEEEIF